MNSLVRLTRILAKTHNRNFSRPFTSYSSSSSSSSSNTPCAVSCSSSIIVRKGDITKWSVNGVSASAIVNASNPDMLWGGKVDQAVHRAAGRELQLACFGVPEVSPGIRCPIGEARITRAFELPVSHVIHTAAPIADAEYDPISLLQSSYRSCLKLAKENNIQHIAFPAICCGEAGLFTAEAADVSISAVKEFRNHFKEVHFVIHNDITYTGWLDKAKELLLVDDVSQDPPFIHGLEDVEVQYRSAMRRRHKEGMMSSSIDELADAVERIVEAIDRSDVGKRTRMIRIQQELANLDLDRSLFIEAVTYLGRDPTEAHIFLSLDDEYKEEWLMLVLNK